MDKEVPDFRTEEVKDRLLQALLAMEWHPVNSYDIARRDPHPYVGLRCPACSGVHPDSPSMEGQGHRDDCDLVKCLMALGHTDVVMNGELPEIDEEFDVVSHGAATLRQAEWFVHTTYDGGERRAGYCCPACNGIRSGSPLMPGDGHEFWCILADVLKELDSKYVEQKAPSMSYTDFIAEFRPMLDDGAEPKKIMQAMSARFPMLGIEDDRKQMLLRKARRDLGS